MVAGPHRPQTEQRAEIPIKAPPDAVLAGLLTASQQGDGVAYAAFLATAVPLLRQYGRAKLSGRAADLEDFVQDTLLSLHQARATYQPGRPVLPWVYAIARNRLADLLRRRYRRLAVEADYDETVADNVPQQAAEEPPDLAPLLAKLPAGQRQAVELVKLQQLSLREASVRSGIGVGALKVAVHRGIAGLRQMMVGKDTHDG